MIFEIRKKKSIHTEPEVPEFDVDSQSVPAATNPLVIPLLMEANVLKKKFGAGYNPRANANLIS